MSCEGSDWGNGEVILCFLTWVFEYLHSFSRGRWPGAEVEEKRVAAGGPWRSKQSSGGGDLVPLFL